MFHYSIHRNSKKGRQQIVPDAGLFGRSLPFKAGEMVDWLRIFLQIKIPARFLAGIRREFLCSFIGHSENAK